MAIIEEEAFDMSSSSAEEERIDSAQTRDSDRDPTPVQSVERALVLLSVLAEEQSGMRLADISERVGLHASTAYRLLATLVKNGYARQGPEDKVYRLGLRLLHLGEAARTQIDLHNEAARFLADLTGRTGRLTSLAVLSGRCGVIIAQNQPRPHDSIMLFSPLGALLPLHCTAVGKAILAHLPEDEVDRIFEEEGLQAFTANTITDRAGLLEELAQVRQQGYAVDRGERDQAIFCVGSPIWNHQGKVVAAVSVGFFAGQVELEGIEELSAEVVKTALQISGCLGFQIQQQACE